MDGSHIKIAPKHASKVSIMHSFDSAASVAMVSKRIIVAQILSAKASNQRAREETFMSSFKSTIERIRALETERKNLLLEIEELKRMADAKAKALESEINMLRDEVRSLRVLLSGEEIDSDLRKKR
jgi:uncharacterized protein YlxW (UPF0749 family)